MSQPTILEMLLVGVAALLASTIAAVTGTGGGIILLPVLVALLGVRDAVPAYTLAQFVGNVSRVWFNRREVRLPVVGWFTLGAVPAAVVGGLLFARSAEATLTRLLGAFLLAMVIWRRLRPTGRVGFPVRHFTIIGAAFAFVSALLGSAGPFLAPFFLSFGLVKGAYIGTEALATSLMHVAKMGTYAAAKAFAVRAVVVGLGLLPAMVAGAFLGKRIVDRCSDVAFVILVDMALVAFGALFLIRG